MFCIPRCSMYGIDLRLPKKLPKCREIFHSWNISDTTLFFLVVSVPFNVGFCSPTRMFRVVCHLRDILGKSDHLQEHTVKITIRSLQTKCQVLLALHVDTQVGCSNIGVPPKSSSMSLGWCMKSQPSSRSLHKIRGHLWPGSGQVFLSWSCGGDLVTGGWSQLPLWHGTHPNPQRAGGCRLSGGRAVSEPPGLRKAAWESLSLWQVLVGLVLYWSI